MSLIKTPLSSNDARGLEKQLVGLKHSCDRIQRRIDRNARVGRDNAVLVGLLGNQRARLQMVADALAQNMVAEPVRIGGNRILPDLTVDLTRYAPTRKRFDRLVMNHGRLQSWDNI
jgi:hypothetical protein